MCNFGPRIGKIFGRYDTLSCIANFTVGRYMVQFHGWELVGLPFLFGWRGDVGYVEVTISANGEFFAGHQPSNNGCCEAFPIELGGYYVSVPRIAVAQTHLNPVNGGGGVYTAEVDGAFVISWEGVSLIDEPFQQGLNFQAVLYPEGNIEMRWGDGNPQSEVFAIAGGLEEDGMNMIVPVTGAPFDGTGGVSRSWPQNQCRLFEVTPDNRGYAQFP